AAAATRYHAGAARAEAGGGKGQPPEEGKRGQRDDEEHDCAEQPDVAFEQAGVGDPGLPLGPAAELALEPPLPALPPPVRVGAAQVVGPFPDHLLLLGSPPGNGLLRSPQRRLALLLP